MRLSVDIPTAAGVRRAVRAWTRSVCPEVLPAVPGASPDELRELAALGGIAAALGHDEAASWPDAVARWAFHAPRPPLRVLNLIERAFDAGLDPLALSYNASISAANRRRLGTVFTPDDVVEHMLDLVADQLDVAPAVVVDPGAGVGAFTLAAARRWPTARIIAVDVNPVTLGLLAARVAYERKRDPDLAGADVDLRLADYMEELPRLFARSALAPIVALGNPPYTRTQALSADYKRRAAELAAGMITSGHANLAMLFQALTLAHLRESDLSCMVLPASIVYTRAARDLRAAIWTTKRPVAVQRWPAEARAFIGRNVQAAVVLVGPEAGERTPIEMARVATKDGDVETIEAWTLDRTQQPPRSWYSLEDSPPAKEAGPKLGELAKVRRGVATGANSFFFLDDDAAARLPQAVLTRAVPTLRFFDASELTAAEHDEWGQAGKRRWLLTIDPDEDLNGVILEYVQAHAAIEHRHLCQQRAVWWAITDQPRPDILVSPLSKTAFKIVLNSVGAVPSNNLLGIWVHDGGARPLAAWLRSPAGQVELQRVGRRYHGGSRKIEPGGLRDVRLPARVGDLLER